MAFNVAYYDLLDKNIRHIYSSLPSNVRFRCDPEPGVTLNPHDGCLTPSNKRRASPKEMHPSLYRRLWTYSSEFDCPLPRAPALRSVSPDKAQLIVSRVNQRTPTHRRRRRHNDVDSDVTTTSHVSSSSSRPSTSLSGCSTVGTGTAVTTEDTVDSRGCSSTCSRTQAIEDLTYRLMKPTIAWNIRTDLREGSVLDPVEVVNHRVRRRQFAIYAARSAHL